MRTDSDLDINIQASRLRLGVGNFLLHVSGVPVSDNPGRSKKKGTLTKGREESFASSITPPPPPPPFHSRARRGGPELLRWSVAALLLLIAAVADGSKKLACTQPERERQSADAATLSAPMPTGRTVHILERGRIWLPELSAGGVCGLQR